MPMAATAIVVLIVGSMIACNVDIMSAFGPQVSSNRSCSTVVVLVDL